MSYKSALRIIPLPGAASAAPVIPFPRPAAAPATAPAPASLFRTPEPPHVPLTAFNAAVVGDRPAPARRWIVEDWLPIGRATLLYADGGTGKTTLAQQLMTACATGTPWLGIPVMQCRSVAILGEDDPEEVHFRQQQINAELGIAMGDLGETAWFAGIGADNALMSFDRDGAGKTTRRFDELRQAALDRDAKMIVVDAAASAFDGKEIDRAQVTRFMGALTRLALDIDGAVLLLAHPSQSGMMVGGSKQSGSSAWNNAARSRWYLSRVIADGEEADPDARILSREKSNWSRRGVSIKMRWTRGAFLPTDAGSAPGAPRPSVAEVFMALLAQCEARGVRVSASPNAGNYVAKLFAGSPDAHGYSRRQIEAAMRVLLVSGKVHLAPYGKPSDGTRELRIKPDSPPPETDE